MQLRSLSFAKLAMVAGVAGLLVAGAAVRQMPRKYVSSAILNLGDPSTFRGPNFRSVLNDAEAMTFSRTSLEQIIRSQRLYPDLQAQIPMEDVIMSMRRQIDVHVIQAPQRKDLTPIRVQFVYTDQQGAERGAAALTSKLIADIGTILSARGVQVLDPPSRPNQPISPKIPVILLAGLFAGILVGAATFGVIRLTA